MTTWRLDELQAVAVADEGGEGSVAWDEAQVVFARADEPSQLLVVDHYLSRDAEYAVGATCSEQQFERDLAEGLFRRIDPLTVPSFHRVVCNAKGRCEVVRRTTLQARRNRALADALGEAIRRATADADRDEVTEAFDAAWDIDPWALEPNLLRCGWRVLHTADGEEALKDLLHAAPDPSTFMSVRSTALWNGLEDLLGSPSHRLCRGLLVAARNAADERLAPGFDLEPPVAERVVVKATLLAALRRRWGLSQPVALAHDELADALRGVPAAMDVVETHLRGVPEWARWSELADRAPTRCLDLMRDQFGHASAMPGRARRADLLGLARTWNTLEANDSAAVMRSARWRSALGELGAWHVRGGAPWRQGEQLAEAVRRHWTSDGAPIESVFAWMHERLGVRVDGAELGDAEASVVGALPQRAPPCVFLGRPSRHDPLASRFAAAHELAHLLLAGREARRDESWFCTTGGDSDSDDHERLANGFAVYLLAPREQVRDLISSIPHARSHEFIELSLRVRKHFGLTAVTAAEHLLNCVGRPEHLPRLPDDVRAKLRGAQKEQTPFEARDAAPLMEATTGRSEAFRKTLERCVDLGAVTEAKAREVLPRAAA